MSIKRHDSLAAAMQDARVKAHKYGTRFQVRQMGKLYAVGVDTMLPHHFFTSGDGGSLIAILDETGYDALAA